MSDHPSYSSSSYGTWAVDTGDGDQVCAGVTKAKAQEIARKRRRAGDKGATAYDTSRAASERYNPRRRRRKNPMGDTWIVTHANPATKPRANTRRYYVVLRNDKTGVDTYMILRPESHKDATTIMGKLVPIPTNRKHQRYMLVESSAATDRYAATGEGPRANPKRAKFKAGDRVFVDGYEGVVTRQLPYAPSLYEVRMPGGLAVKEESGMRRVKRARTNR